LGLFLAKVRVAGSNPVVRSREIPGSGGAQGLEHPDLNSPETLTERLHTIRR